MTHDLKVLVIEDEKPIRTLLRAALEGKGYTQIESETGSGGLAMAASQSPDIVILDLGLPDMDGKDFIGRIREWSPVPIIVISARDQEMEKVAALDAGADDYLTKPFSVEELQARLRAALRHHNQAAGSASVEPLFVHGELKVDMAARRVFVAENETHLTPIEYRLLTALVRHAGKVMTHKQLIKEVWGPGHEEQTHYLRIFMANLRKKIEADSANPRYLKTEQGVGYRLLRD
ncbi:MAG: response regulator [Nitrospinae bacterium]|nr:response regulator [Nitrospinota bacterium]MBF0635420.1 response regulator [Nitrospinota bacterium]